MKMMVVRGFITALLGVMASLSFADERAAGPSRSGEVGKTLAGYQSDCSSIADKKKKAECEEANKAMAACKGQRAEAVAKCVMEQHSRGRGDR